MCESETDGIIGTVAREQTRQFKKKHSVHTKNLIKPKNFPELFQEIQRLTYAVGHVDVGVARMKNVFYKLLSW